MSLANGTRLGPYEIVSPLGAGGMGEVYRARDTVLDRDVALKILPESFSGDPDRLMRFEREAKTLASLNHPNIAAIYGLESGGVQRALVMELVEGEDLSTRIARGAIPPADATALARQIIDALEAAHEAGIVHRDLKPANIKIRDDGTVKVLDFGLAKALDPNSTRPGDNAATANPGPGTLDPGPTMTSPALTQLGVILGTAAYMAPEQAKGRPVDKRADIWAFGVIWCEMLTGRSAFAGETITDVIAAVVTRDPDWEALPAATPTSIRRLLRRCLEKDPKRRLRDIGDARIALDEAGEAEEAPDAPVPASARSSRLLVSVLAAAALGSMALAGWLWRSGSGPVPPVHLSIALPAGHALMSGPAISRDGQRVAFVSSDGIARPQLYIRDIDDAEARLIPGTEEASDPFFSPDGRRVAFYAGNRLFKVNVDGGAPMQLADSTSHDGGTWTDAGTIIFNKAWNGGLEVVSENGGPAKTLIAPTPPDEYAYTWPLAIPGTNDVLFASWGKEFSWRLMDTSTMTTRTVCAGCWRRMAWVPTGHIVGANSGDLLAMKLADAGDPEPEAVAVIQGVYDGSMDGDSPFAVSQNGTLLYVRGDEGRRTVVTVDRRGQVSPQSAPELNYLGARIAPDGRRVATLAGGTLRIVDLERGTATPLTPELDARSGARSSPVWSRDGLTVTFGSNHEGNWEIYSRVATGAGDIVPVLKLPMDQHPQSYAPDGTLLFTSSGPQTGTDLWILPPGGEARAWLATGAEEGLGAFSPDGRFVAYVSNASGRSEVYLQSRDDASDRLPVSANGGGSPMWSPKGDRLFFRHGSAIMEAVIRTGGKLSVSTPVRLFDGGWTLSQQFPFDVMPDGEHFLMVQQPLEAVPTRIEVVLNWFTMLADKIGRR